MTPKIFEVSEMPSTIYSSTCRLIKMKTLMTVLTQHISQWREMRWAPITRRLS